MKYSIITLIVTSITFSGCNLNAQNSTLYMPNEMVQAYKKGTRSMDGRPGNSYWQNHSKYDLKVELEPVPRKVSGSGTITYFNESPDTLNYVIIKLLQDIHKYGNARDYHFGAEKVHEGLQLLELKVNNQEYDLQNRRQAIFWGTNLYIVLGKENLLYPGESLMLDLKWNYELVFNGIRNGAFTDSSFFIGYWYPQMAVYDDVMGWDKEDYTGKQETYNDLGEYRVEITVPEEYFVWATGTQTNEEETYSKKVLDRINQSRSTDIAVPILRQKDLAERSKFTGEAKITWKYEASDVPDFAFSASNYYLWDALSIDASKDKPVWVNAVYPEGTASFDKVAKIAAESIHYLSTEFPGIPYPFDKHITYNGIHQVAVEYPMMANNSDHESDEMYTEITIHEIAHNYIPFYMLANERNHAWIDEGWVKLTGELYGEEMGVARPEKKDLNTYNVYSNHAGTYLDLPLIVHSSCMTSRNNFQQSYAKATHANLFLLEIMKEKGIDNPLKVFIETWKHKHPMPWDFFNLMNGLAGEDLSWYWNPWYFEFAKPDMALSNYAGDEFKIQVNNKGGLPLPVHLTLHYANGEDKVLHYSPCIWESGKSFVDIEINNIQNLESIELGKADIPDINPEDNLFQL